MSIRCYKCGSKNVTVSVNTDQSYSVGKGLVGTLLFGTGGAAMGVNGKTSENKRFICQACGEVATFSMNADTCAGIEKALRENDEFGLKIMKRLHSNIEWEEPIEEETEEKEEKKDNSVIESGSLGDKLIKLKKAADSSKGEEKEIYWQELVEVFWQYISGFFKYGEVYTATEIMKMLPGEWGYLSVKVILGNKFFSDKILIIQRGTLTKYTLLWDYYCISIAMFEDSQTIDDYMACKFRFENLKNYEYTQEFLEECDKKINDLKYGEKYKKACLDFENAKSYRDYKNLSVLFESMEGYKQSREYIEKCKKQLEVTSKRIENNLCQYCGGNFKGLFTKICKACGKQKDY